MSMSTNQQPTAGAALRLTGATTGTFSHSEAAAITGLTSDALLIYQKRAMLPARAFPRQELGRGKRRQYRFDQVVILSAARALIDSGVPVRDAMELASFH